MKMLKILLQVLSCAQRSQSWVRVSVETLVYKIYCLFFYPRRYSTKVWAVYGGSPNFNLLSRCTSTGTAVSNPCPQIFWISDCGLLALSEAASCCFALQLAPSQLAIQIYSMMVAPRKLTASGEVILETAWRLLNCTPLYVQWLDRTPQHCLHSCNGQTIVYGTGTNIYDIGEVHRCSV